MSEKKILIVDDNRVLVQCLEFVLNKGGYRIETATDESDAIEKTKRLKPQLALVNLQLSSMDGMGFCRRLKSDPALQKVFIIALTAVEISAKWARMQEITVDEYLMKPISLMKVIDRIWNFFRFQDASMAQKRPSN